MATAGSVDLRGRDPSPTHSDTGAPTGATGRRAQLVRGLDATAAASIIVGIIIGSGIFRTPNEVAEAVGASGLIFVVYIAAGLLVLMGALCYAELGAMLPKSGGAYIYFREAYGDMPAFLLGWASFVVTQVGSVAAVAVFFGELGGILFGYGTTVLAINLVASSAVILLALTNTLGVRLAGHVQVAFTVFKISALMAVILVGIYLGTGEPVSLTPTFPPTWDFGLVQLIGLAMVPALFAYDGWTNANNVAEEIQDVQRNLPRALVMGVLFVIGIYLLANFAYLWALGLEGLSAAEGSAAAQVFLNGFGECIDVAGWCIGPGQLITLVIFLSLFGSLNGQTISYPRIFFAMAKDRLFFRFMSRTHPRFKTPHLAIAAQTIWAIILIFWGAFEDLAELVVFASFLFYGLAGLAVIVLRRKHPEWPRPYKVPLYPVLPAFFVLAAFFFTLNLIFESPKNSFLGLGLVLLGIPVFYVWRSVYREPVVREDPTQQASDPDEETEGPL